MKLNLTCTILALETPLLVFAGQAKSSIECLVLSGMTGPVPLRTDH